MTAHRTLARFCTVAAAPVLLTVVIQMLVVEPAQAHGAPDNPVSRVYACSPEGGQAAKSAACKAAIAVSGAKALTEWDNLRVPNVNGRDRQLIPDGKLCSGGLAAYRGLDLPRTDWPSTRVTAGSSIRFSYRTTIPHAGSFRMYVTRDSYDPTKPLTWSDLESKPFLTASNPPITGGAYVMPGRLPAAKTGRHMIYTIWQTTSTPDTYYSCSDAVFVAGAGAGAPAPGASRPAAVPPDAAQATDGAQPPTQQQPNLPTGTAVAPAPGANSVPIARASNSVGRMAPVAAVGLAVLAVAGAAGAFIWRRRRI